MNANMHQFQNSGTSGGALSRPPGLEAPASIRKVSFADDFEVSPKPRLADAWPTVAPSQAKEVQPPQFQSTGAEVSRFCVYCGTKVAEKLLKMNNVKFCVHCGHQHPEHFMGTASKAIKPEEPNEENAALISLQQKVETLKAVDMLTQLITICDAQLMPAISQGQFAPQQVPWNGALDKQCRQSDSSREQHGAARAFNRRRNAY